MSSSKSLDLPGEIWCKIFTFLSADDRKNVRQTCSHFYKLCEDTQVRGTEEMVFHGDLNTGAALELLSSSHSLIRNIRLNNVHVTDTFLPFFEKHGGNIHSLILRKCRFDVGLFRGILERCTAMRTFVLTLEFIYEKQFFKYVFNDIRELSENSITFPQVVDLKLKLGRANEALWAHPNTIPWTNRTFLQFFALFPNARRVDFEFNEEKSFIHLSTISSDIMSDKRFTLSSIYDRVFAARNQLESLRLRFNFYDRSHLTHLTLELLDKITQIEMKNLKELSLNWIDSSHSFATNPFLTFQNLTHFECDFYYHPISSPSTAVQLLLSTVTRLRTLKFKIPRFPMSKECFEALVRSQLTTLKIEYDVSADFEASSLSDNLVPNYRLKHFFIHQTLTPRNVPLLFASYFRGLQHIRFNKVTEDTLYNIFEYQKNVLSLSLYNKKSFYAFDRDTNNVIDYAGYQRFLQNGDLSQYRLLPHLTYLHLEEDHIGLTNFLLSEFKFPQLKSLTITTGSQNDANEQFWKILSKMTQLQFLGLRFGTGFYISSPQLLMLVQSLSNLCHISIHDGGDIGKIPECFSPSEYLQLFDARSSLRAVNHNYIKYFYDATTKTVRNIPNPYKNALRFQVIEPFHSWACDGVPHYLTYKNKCWK